MKKIIFASFLVLSITVFAKEEPKVKTDLSKTQKVLIAKKTMANDQKKAAIIVLNKAAKQEELSDEDLCIIELALGPVIAGPPYHCVKLSQSTN